MHHLFAPEPVEKPTQFEITDPPPPAGGQGHVGAEMVLHCRSIWRRSCCSKSVNFPERADAKKIIYRHFKYLLWTAAPANGTRHAALCCSKACSKQVWTQGTETPRPDTKKGRPS
jgi:hypothetical protein